MKNIAYETSVTSKTTFCSIIRWPFFRQQEVPTELPRISNVYCTLIEVPNFHVTFTATDIFCKENYQIIITTTNRGQIVYFIICVKMSHDWATRKENTSGRDHGHLRKADLKMPILHATDSNHK